MSEQSTISSAEQIDAAAAAFWGIIYDKFPEITSGDSTIIGEDKGALRCWANGNPGDERTGMRRLSIPSYITDERVADAVVSAMDAATIYLQGVRPECYDDALHQLKNCAREMIHYNAPAAGTFIVEVYHSKQVWDAAKGADDFIDDFETIEDAKQCALDVDYSDAYQLTVKAYGHHVDFEPGEVVFKRFDRSA